MFVIKNYYLFLKTIKKNLKKIWSGIRSTLNIKNAKVIDEYSLLTDKDLPTNERDLANHFNTFFISIAQKLVNKILSTNNNFENFMKNQNKMSFIGPVDIKETEIVISSLQVATKWPFYQNTANI